MNSSSNNSNSIWTALIHHAIIGNGQHPLSEELKQQLRELNIDTDDDQHTLLEGIALVQLLEKAAKKWVHNDTPLAPPPSFGQENPCSIRSMQHLRAILDGHHTAAFPEFTSLLAKHGRSLPPASLPKLLDQCVQNADLWQLIQPILGKRGLWLLQQHPDWQTLLPKETDQTHWHQLDDTRQAKAFLLFRAQSPKAARISLLKYWPDMDYKTKARLLPAFSHGLSLEDENFLEGCLLDKRKKVRQIASDHLVSLVGSRLVKRLFDAANNCLSIKSKSLQINLPEHLPEHTKKDGILPTGTKFPGGIKLNWLYQLLARIPFSFWEREWTLDAMKIVRLFAQSGHPSLVNGITESLVRFPHIEGTHAQIQLWMNSGNDIFWQSLVARELLDKASETFFNSCLIRWLEQYGPFLPANSLAAFWLSHSKHGWQPPLSKIVLLGFQDIIQNRSSPDWQLYHYKHIIHAAAYHSQSDLLDDFKKKWSMQSSTFGRWAIDVEKFLQSMNFRVEMEKEIRKFSKKA